jgi:predicted alpha/beta hydrolase family esterase
MNKYAELTIKYEDLVKFAEDVKGVKHYIQNAGHLNTDAGYTTFPELIEVIKQIEK